MSDDCVEFRDIPVDSAEPVYMWKSTEPPEPPPSSQQAPPPEPPRPFHLAWRAANTQVALLSWNMSVDGERGPLGQSWVPFADDIVQRKGCEVFAVMDPSGCPLFLVGRLYHVEELGDISADTVVYTVAPVEQRLGGRVELDYDSPITATTIQRAFALAQERGADIILIGDTAKKDGCPKAEMWLAIDGTFWYEKVLPVHVEGAPAFGFKKGPMPIEELRAIFRRATWEGFRRYWYLRPSEFWPKKAAGIPEGGSAMEALQYLRKNEPDWIIENCRMIYNAIYHSVVGHGGGPEPYDYVCMWRRPGFVGDFQPFNPVIRQFVQYVGGWDDID